MDRVPHLLVAFAYAALGAFMIAMPRDDVAAYIGSRDDELIGWVRFIGLATLVGGAMLAIPGAVRARAPTPRVWIADGVALVAAVFALLIIGRGDAFLASLMWSVSFIAAAAAACFAIWGPDELRLSWRRWGRRGPTAARST